MKSLLVFFIFLFFFLLSACLTPTHAGALLSIAPDGQITWQVLAFSDELNLAIPNYSSLEVESLALSSTPSPPTTVYLQKNVDHIELTVESGNVQQAADVTNFSEDIIEIKQTLEPQTVRISAKDGTFSIAQNGVSAQADFPIQVSADRRQISVETASGLKYLAVLPYQAVENALQANLINRLDSAGSVHLSESSSGELEYQISGARVIDVLNIIQHRIPVQASISASTGQVLHVDQPLWFSVLSFLFV